MFAKSPVWNFAARLSRRLAREMLLRRQPPMQNPKPGLPPTPLPLNIQSEEDPVRKIDDQIRRTFRAETVEVAEEVVRARKEIWGGMSGREFSFS